MNDLINRTFGISNAIPYSYISRKGKDDRFEWLCKSHGNHIVIHGWSKQWKTSLRRRYLPECDIVSVSCKPNSTIQSIYQNIYHSLMPQIQESGKIVNESSITAKQEVETNFPKFIKLKFWIDATNKESVEYFFKKNSHWEMSALIQDIFRESRKKYIVLEDFHYLVTDVQKELAFDLKWYYDSVPSVLCVLIWVWSEQMKLVSINSELRDRIEEVDMSVWTNEELETVIRQWINILNWMCPDGCNVSFTNEEIDWIEAYKISLSDQMVESVARESLWNVGICQVIMRDLCTNAWRQSLDWEGQTKKRKSTEKYRITLDITKETLEVCLKQKAKQDTTFNNELVSIVKWGKEGVKLYAQFFSLIQRELRTWENIVCINSKEALRLIRAQYSLKNLQEASVINIFSRLNKKYPSKFNYDEIEKEFFFNDPYFLLSLRWTGVDPLKLM